MAVSMPATVALSQAAASEAAPLLSQAAASEAAPVFSQAASSAAPAASHNDLERDVPLTQASAGGGDTRDSDDVVFVEWQGLGLADDDAKGAGGWRARKGARGEVAAAESDAESDVIELDEMEEGEEEEEIEVVDCGVVEDCVSVCASDVPSPFCSPPVSPPRDVASAGLVDVAAAAPFRGQASGAKRRAAFVEECCAVLDDDDGDVYVVDILESPPKSASVASTAMPSASERVADADKDEGGAIEGGEVYRELCTSYHVRAFDYVVDFVLGRYAHILRASDVALARRCCAMSGPARSLFVRLYRRKPAWHAVGDVAIRYAKDLKDGVVVGDSLKELVQCGLMSSSNKVTASSRRNVAVEVLGGLSADSLRALCGVVPGGKRLRARGREEIVAGLLRVIVDGADAVDDVLKKQKGRRKQGGFVARKRLRQSTIDGSNPAENLVRAILRSERIAIPRSVLVALRRVNFLFFFESGSDSPWVMLASVGRAQFPRYRCIRTLDVFVSALAYEDYEAARNFEASIESAILSKNWDRALDLGASVEVAVSDFLKARGLRGSSQALIRPVYGEYSSQWVGGSMPLSRLRDCAYAEDVERQLLHPFFRRYTAIVRYCRALWISVKALERNQEYVTAVRRLRLLLSTSLLPAHVGRMTDRLTVNLVHLGEDQTALDVIVSTLSSSEASLHRGEIANLARRGARLHRRLRHPVELARVPGAITAKSRRLKAADAVVASQEPPVIANALRRLRTSVPVRMLRGKALPSRRRGEAQNTRRDDEDDEAQVKTQDVGVKSRFVGLAAGSLDVSVEELALEWYRAHSQWNGVHDEGHALRFIWCLLLYDAIYADVPDVFQTPYQVAPWDLDTEVFYSSRKQLIDFRLSEIEAMSSDCICAVLRDSYTNESRYGVLCISSAWDSYSVDDICCIAAGLGGKALSHIFGHFCRDYGYWSGGLPDLMLWRWTGEKYSDSARDEAGKLPVVKLVEVKSQRDVLSSKQRAWLSVFLDAGVDCEVFKVVEKETKRNSDRLLDSDLDAKQLEYLELEELASADSDAGEG